MTSLDIFTCIDCKQDLVQTQKSQQHFLYCQCCQLYTPVIEGFPLFTQTSVYCDSLTDTVTQLTKKFSDKQRYENYLESKYQRDIIEVYAAFQPFNESSRAIYPFIDYLQSTVKKGDLIIDSWSRTGWSALLLSSLFPEQQVISFWEGDNSVLGYSGYGYWFSAERLPKNLTIAFLAPEQNFPLKENSVRIIHGHDILHRRPMENHILETLRVTSHDGIIMLPHVHLSNSEPIPYFERGGTIRHGREYKTFCQNTLLNSHLNAMVLSETEIFEAHRPITLKDSADSLEYNGMIIIAPKKLFQQPLTENWLNRNMSDMHIIANPLLSVCYFTRLVSLNSIGKPNQVNYLLDRHPVYKQRLDNALPETITPLQRDILIYSNDHLSLGEISKLLNVEISKVTAAAIALSENEIITLLPVSSAALELQEFHSNHHSVIKNNFSLSLISAIEIKPSTIIMTIDNEPVSLEDLLFLINAWRRYLQLKNDTDCLVLRNENSLAIPLVMACWIENINVESNYTDDQIEMDLFTNKSTQATTSISFMEGVSNSYWDIIEPFISDDIMPFPLEKQQAKAVVGTEPWYLWLNKITSLMHRMKL